MKRKTMLLANLSQSASHSSMLWLVKMIEVPDLRVEQGFTAAQPEDKTLLRPEKIQCQLEINLLIALMVSHIFLLAAGSTPVVGSSNSITFGLKKIN